MDHIKSAVLTSIQYLSLFFLLYFNPWFSKHPALLLLQLIGIFVGLWAIFDMRKSALNITPMPLNNAILISSGPYKLVRHPMYLGLLFFFTPLVISHPTNISLIIYAIFIINLILKLFFEEKLLLLKFESYVDYKKNTWRLLPYLF